MADSPGLAPFVYNGGVITRAHEPIPLPFSSPAWPVSRATTRFTISVRAIRGRWSPFARKTIGRFRAKAIVACDAEDHLRLRALFDEYQFRSVLNCAGNCALRACELDSRLAWRTNVEGLINLLSIVVERDVRLVHLSIDLVYSGERIADQPQLAYIGIRSDRSRHGLRQDDGRRPSS